MATNFSFASSLCIQLSFVDYVVFSHRKQNYRNINSVINGLLLNRFLLWGKILAEICRKLYISVLCHTAWVQQKLLYWQSVAM